MLKDARENPSSGLFNAYRRRGPGPAEQELLAAGSARSGFMTPTQVILLLSVGYLRPQGAAYTEQYVKEAFTVISDVLKGLAGMEDLVGKLEHLADQGSHELAADMLLRLLLRSNNPRDWTVNSAMVAGQAAYLLALHLIQVGSARSADALLRCLGCTLRLADTILLYRSAQPLHAASKGLLVHGARVLPDAMPESLFRQLQSGFRQEACYWQESGYNNGSHTFFSFLYELGTPADVPVEAAIQCCKEQLSSSGCDMSRVKVAEWWAHKRAATDAHQLHFDLDETRIGSGSARYKLKHPAYSSVLYLTDSGGPTVVLAQTPSSGPAQDAWLNWPRANHLLCFPGNYLHGVIPGMPPEEGIARQRITLVIVFWDAKMRPQPGPPGSGPMRALPSASPLRSSLGRCGRNELAHRQIHHGDWKAAAHVANPWKNLTAELGHDRSRELDSPREGMQLQISLPPLRFFLLSPEEICDTYQPKHQDRYGAGLLSETEGESYQFAAYPTYP